MVTPASIKEVKYNKNNSNKNQILNLLNKNIKDEDKYIDSKSFQQLANGLFQAEGHIGGYFELNQTSYFRPICYISVNATDESVRLFRILNKNFDNKLKYIISLNKSGLYHIRIQTRDWNLIVNKWIPYFSLAHGDKLRGLKYLLKVYYIQYSNDKNDIDSIIKKLTLIYNIVDNNQRKISLTDKIKLVLNHSYPDYNINNINYNIYNDYLIHELPKEHNEMSIPFILGFYLGDGTFNIKIRDEGTLLWYIGVLRISQKYTEDNEKLFILISDYLNTYDLDTIIRPFKEGTVIVLKVESNQNIKKLSKLLHVYEEFYFIKKDQLYFMNKSSKLLGLVKYWKEGNIVLLNLISEYNLNYRVKNDTKYKYYLNKIEEGFKNQSDLYFLSKVGIEGYLVKLPIKIKPKTKYFYYKTYNKDKDLTLKTALDYRDRMLNLYLIENDLIKS
jgi:hypothetical protein